MFYLNDSLILLHMVPVCLFQLLHICMNIHSAFICSSGRSSVTISLHVKVVRAVSIIDNSVINIFADIHNNLPRTNS